MDSPMEFYVFIIALAVPLVGIPILFLWRPKAGIVFLGVYLLSYLPFSMAGNYVIANHGGDHWTEEWIPQMLMTEYSGLVGRTKTEITLAGAAYWPCIISDRFIWHRTTDRSPTYTWSVDSE